MFVAFCAESGRNLIGVICTISNYFTITSGNTAIINNNYGGDYFSVTALSDTKVFIAYGYGSNSSRTLSAVVCTVNNLVISKGTATQLSSEQNTGNKIFTTTLSDSKVIVCHKYTGNTYVGGIICDIENTTITYGNDTVLLGSGATNTSYGIPLRISDNKVVVAIDKLDKICTISENTITIDSSQSAGYSGYTCLLTSNKRIIFSISGAATVLIDNIYTGLCKVVSPTQILTGIAKSNGSAGDTVKVIVPDVA